MFVNWVRCELGAKDAFGGIIDFISFTMIIEIKKVKGGNPTTTNKEIKKVFLGLNL